MFLIGLFMSCFGLPLSIWSFRILYVLDNNSHVRLSGNLTEENIATAAVISILLIIVGIILMIFGKAKRKNKEIADSIINSNKLNYCQHCRTNVDSKNGICPICNQKIGG